jgi:hypothetical protein
MSAVLWRVSFFQKDARRAPARDFQLSHGRWTGGTILMPW